MKNIDKGMLPPDFNTDKGEDGLYAEFHEDGTLAHYGFYEDGELGGWGLFVDAESHSASAQRVVTLEYTSGEEEISNNGHGHHEPTEEEQEDFQEFVEYWVTRISEDKGTPVPRCSFCEKTSEEVRKLIAGPTSYICNECVQLCQEILAEEEATDE